MTTPTEGDRVVYKPNIIPHYGEVTNERVTQDGERAVWVEWDGDDKFDYWVREEELQVVEDADSV